MTRAGCVICGRRVPPDTPEPRELVDANGDIEVAVCPRRLLPGRCRPRARLSLARKRRPDQRLPPRHEAVSPRSPTSARICLVDHCEAEAKAYGLCWVHAGQLRRQGDPNKAGQRGESPDAQVGPDGTFRIPSRQGRPWASSASDGLVTASAGRGRPRSTRHCSWQAASAPPGLRSSPSIVSTGRIATTAGPRSANRSPRCSRPRRAACVSHAPVPRPRPSRPAPDTTASRSLLRSRSRSATRLVQLGTAGPIQFEDRGRRPG